MIYIRILLAFLILISPVYAARNITLPFSEDFTLSTSIDDLAWTTAGNGASVTRTAESWRGGGNYCVRIDPPTSGPSSGQGGYAAIGAFLFSSSTAQLTVAFAVNIGTTYSNSATGTMGNKFVDVFHPTERFGILGILNQGGCGYHEWGVQQQTTEQYYYYGASSTPCRNEIIFDNTAGAKDYGGEWMWINYVIDNANNLQYLRVWTQDGAYSGTVTYISITSTPAGDANEVRTIGGYYNEYHPTADTNSRILIDDLMMTANTTAIEPPAGFLTGGSVSTPRLNGVTIYGGGIR